VGPSRPGMGLSSETFTHWFQGVPCSSRPAQISTAERKAALYAAGLCLVYPGFTQRPVPIGSKECHAAPVSSSAGPAVCEPQDLPFQSKIPIGNLRLESCRKVGPMPAQAHLALETVSCCCCCCLKPPKPCGLPAAVPEQAQPLQWLAALLGPRSE
jgi:hypothetical protein